MKGLRTYIDYVELKLHFNSMHFVWKYTTKGTKANSDTFVKRKDRKIFETLESKFSDHRECVELMISAFINDKNTWVGDILSFQVEEIHRKRLRRINSLQNTVSNDLSLIEDYCDDRGIEFKTVFLTYGMGDPIICQINTVSLETLVILDRIYFFSDTWFPINPLKKEIKLRLKKYDHLLPSLSSEQINYLNLA